MSTSTGARVGFVRVASGVDTTLLAFAEQLRVALVENDWSAFGRLFQADAVLTDDRSGLRAEVSGRDAIVEGIHATYGGRPLDVEWELLTSRGRIGMMRMLFFGAGDDVSGAWESDRLAVFELAPTEDVLVRGHYVDPTDREAALSIFRQWTVGVRAGPVRVAPGVDPTHQVLAERSRIALVTQDWEAYAAFIHPEIVVIDERAGLRADVLGRDAWVSGIKAAYGGRTFDVDDEILASQGRVILMRVVMFGTGDNLGGPWESDRLMVMELDPIEDMWRRGHYVDPSDMDKAFAIFRQWSTGVRATPDVDTRHVEWWKPFRAAMVEKRWDDFAAFWHPQTLYADRRPGLQSEVHGRDETVRVIRESFGTREFDYDVEILASRGDANVASTRFFGLGDELGGPWEAERLVLVVLDKDDLALRAELFPPDDRKMVFSMLDAFGSPAGRVRAAPGVDPRLVALWERLRAAMVAKDWGVARSLVHPHIVWADRRAGLLSEVVGGDETVRGLRESYGTRDFDFDIEILASRGTAYVSRARYFGPGDDFGGPWETERLHVGAFDDDGLMTRSELLDVGDIEDAFDRLRDLAGGGVRAAPGVDPSRIALSERIRAMLVAKDWDVYALTWHPQAVYIDHRAGLRSEVHGRDEVVRVIRESYGTRDFDYDIEILATRGEAVVSVVRFFGQGDDLGGPWEAERLMLAVLADDQVVRSELFELDDREKVLAILGAYGPQTGGVRAAPGVDPRFIAFWERARRALVTKDWAAAGSLVHPNLVWADRRPGLHSETVGREEFVRIIRESYGTREFDFDVEILASRGNANVYYSRFFGSGDALGGPWETDRLGVVELDDSGVMTGAVILEPGDLETAFGILRERAGGGVRTSADVDPRHRALWERFRAALVAKDWEAFAMFLSPDLVHSDRRPGLQSEVSGIDEYVRVMRESFGTREIDYDVEILASRGNTGLAHNLLLGPGDALGGPFEAGRLVWFAVDDADRFLRFELYDPEDRAAAFKRLEEPAQPESALRALVRRFIDAYNTRDWATFASSLAPDVVLEDHRPTGWGSSKGVESFVSRIKVGVDAAPDARVVIESWVRESDDIGLVRMPMRGRVSEGSGEFELDRLFLVTAEAGRIALMEIFDVDDPRALERFDELNRASTGSGPHR